MKKIFKAKESLIVLMIILMIVIFSVTSPRFLTYDNIKGFLKSNVMFFVLSLGMTLVIVSGGVDVSIPAMTAASAMIFGRLVTRAGIDPAVSFFISLASGIILGLINGLLIAKTKISPIVTTLGMQSVISGMLLVVTDGKDQWITAGDFPEKFKTFGSVTFIGIPIQIWFVLAVVFITWFIMKFTMLGRSIYAVGGNIVSAERIGLNGDRVKIFVYAYMGAMCAIGGFLNTSALLVVDPNAYNGYDMKAIAAVVVGGGSMVGGVGSVWGTVIGVLFMVILGNGLGLLRVDSYWRDIVVGVVLVVAVSIDAIRRTKAEKNSHHVDVLE